MAVDGGGDDADEKVLDVTVQSKTLARNNREDGVPHNVVPVGVDPMETFGSLGNMSAGNVQFVEEDERGDSTEYSSSFGDSYSESDAETKLGMDSMEVDSPFLDRTHINAGGTNSAPNAVRHKQVTAEWRKMARPIMWRCQWLELRMKDLLSQVEKYDRELAVINHEKDLQLEMVKADDPKSESAKLDFQSHDRNIMKKRKRKRDEEAMDNSLFLKEHHILSYYGLTSSVNGGFDNLVVEDIDSCFSRNDALVEPNEDERTFQQCSLREILLKVDDTQSRILRLQSFLSNAHNKYEQLSSFLDHKQVKVPKKSQKVQNRLTSCSKDGKRSLQKTKALQSLLQKEEIDKPHISVPPPPALSERSSGCMMGYMKKNGVEEGVAQSNVNEMTFEMLFGADNLVTNADVAEFCKESDDDILIDNQAAKEGYQQFETVKHVAEEHSELVKKFGKTPSHGEKTSAHIVKIEEFQEIAPVAKQFISGSKQGHKPKEQGSSLLALKDESEKSLQLPVKKIKTEKELNNLKNEKPVLVALDTRRSQRVRKPKIYWS